MNLSQAAKAGVLSLAIVPLAGTSLDFDFSSSRWIMLFAAAVIVLPIVILVAKQTVRARRVYPAVPAEVTSERISNHLVVLSSAAVLAIYSAGYVKTRSAADRLAEREKAAKQFAAQAALVVAAPPSQIVAPEPRSAPGTGGDAPSTAKIQRAPASRSTPKQTTSSASAASADPSARFKDGVYEGRGSCPHGDIIAQIAIRKGQIEYAGIAECLTRYSCSVIHMLPEQIVTRQSTNVDVVSGATESTEAFQDAVAAALMKADNQAAHTAEPAGQLANPSGEGLSQ
jgi:uncharacterized protein with FMN-binding domain